MKDVRDVKRIKDQFKNHKNSVPKQIDFSFFLDSNGHYRKPFPSFMVVFFLHKTNMLWDKILGMRIVVRYWKNVPKLIIELVHKLKKQWMEVYRKGLVRRVYVSFLLLNYIILWAPNVCKKSWAHIQTHTSIEAKTLIENK